MIRVKFNISREQLEKLLRSPIWERGFMLHGEKVLNCTADIDNGMPDKDGYDCIFFIDKARDDWDNKKIKPTLLLKGRTMPMFKRWITQMAEYKAKCKYVQNENRRKDFEEIL